VSGDRLFFLDFDGVICDSIDECYVSSWLAYHLGERFSPGLGPALRAGGLPDRVFLEDKSRFNSFRPFIRTGGDYVLLQRCVDRRRFLRSQEDFDAARKEAGESLMAEYHSRFYAERASLLEQEREYWLSLNVLYDGVGEAVRGFTDDERYYILSTKQSTFIAEILASKGIRWPIDRIIDSGKEKKTDIILSVLDSAGIHRGVFVDDQVDYFAGAPQDRISCYLASWGYVKQSWLVGSGYTVISKDFFKALLRGEA